MVSTPEAVQLKGYQMNKYMPLTNNKISVLSIKLE